MTPRVNCSARLSKKQEKSRVLNVRKNNSINTALKANQNINQNHQFDAPQQRKIMTNQSQSPPSFNNVKQQQSSYTVTPDNMSAVSSDDDSDHINVDKLKTIRNKAAQR